MTTEEAARILSADPETFREALKQYDAEAEAKAETDADRRSAAVEKARARAREAYQRQGA